MMRRLSTAGTPERRHAPTWSGCSSSMTGIVPWPGTGAGGLLVSGVKRWSAASVNQALAAACVDCTDGAGS
jgi:hypothetical protein